jgi:PAS domain S-box-containing protein
MSRRQQQAATSTPLSTVSNESILESISDGVFTVDKDWRITSFNRAAEQITGIPRVDAIGRRCSEVFRASMCETQCALKHTLDTGKAVVNKAAFIVDAQGRRIPISVSTALLRNHKGQIAGGAETFRDLTLIEEMRKEIKGRVQTGDLFSRSDAMRRVIELLPLIAESESTVLIEGETGTGKELVARTIHGQSSRGRGPFLAVNCGALPDTLLESELFGYKAGAFTGASRDKVGRFAMAEGGTLFLDEIGEVSQALQVRLLRVLQERTYEPLGATHSQKTTARVIAATNKDLSEMVTSGAFRRDLFYRINVMKVELPPLKNRREDIPLLVEHFITKFNTAQDKHVTFVSPDVLAVFMAHDFPGNVRELQNIIEHAFVLCRDGQIDLVHLPREIVPHAVRGNAKRKMAEAVHASEAKAILDALDRNDWNRLAAARELGLHKSTLFRKVKLLGIELPEEDGRARRKQPAGLSSKAGS